VKNKTYTVKGNRTAADLIAGNEEVIQTGYDLECARIAAIEMQRTGEFIACWVEDTRDFGSPQFARVVEQALLLAAGNPKWEKAIQRAADGLKSGDIAVAELASGCVVTTENGAYKVSHKCECMAFQHGHRQCRHRAARRLVQVYQEVLTRETIEETRTREWDYTGASYEVVRYDGWAI
jgi:hypothetical protein